MELKNGITTGTCAAATTRACISFLLGRREENKILIKTPSSMEVILDVFLVKEFSEGVTFGTNKFSGDDPDVTNGALITTTVFLSAPKSLTKLSRPFEFYEEDHDIKVYLYGGEGIGIVTKPGLEQDIFMPAINRVPREMIFNEVINGFEAKNEYPYREIHVVVQIPEGERLAKETLNESLGIKGGLSILGTSGILFPMSEQALVDTIKTVIRQKAAIGNRTLLLVPGNYGLSYLEFVDDKDIDREDAVKCSNYIGDALDFALEEGFEKIVLVGNCGKLCKLSVGIFNTHSKIADGRVEAFMLHSSMTKVDDLKINEIKTCISTDAMLSVLKEKGYMDSVCQAMLSSIAENMKKRVKGRMEVEVLMFSEKYGFLGREKR